MITKNEQKVLDALYILKIMTSSQIRRAFFKSQPSQNRSCNKLISKNLIYKYLKSNNREILYHSKKNIPEHRIQHTLILSEFYVVCLEKNIEILYFETDYKIDNVIADGYIILKYNNMEYEFLIEVDYGKTFTYKKYYKLKNKDIYFPPIICITDKFIPNNITLEHIRLKTSMENFDNFIKFLE